MEAEAADRKPGFHHISARAETVHKLPLLPATALRFSQAGRLQSHGLHGFGLLVLVPVWLVIYFGTTLLVQWWVFRRAPPTMDFLDRQL